MRHSSKWTRAPWARLIAVAVIAVTGANVGCGNSSPASTTSTPQRTVILQAQFVGLPSSTVVDSQQATASNSVTTTTAGTLDAIVDWTLASNRMNIAFFAAGCTPDRFGSVGCLPLALADGPVKPQKLTFPNAAAGTYVIGIRNVGPGSESGTYQIGLTD